MSFLETHWISDHFGAYTVDILNRKKMELWTISHPCSDNLGFRMYKVKDGEESLYLYPTF